VFPHGTIWSNEYGGQGYDVVLLAKEEPLRIDVAGLQARLDEQSGVAASLQEVGLDVLGLLSTYAGQGPDLREWLHDAEINRDRNLRLQYLAGMGYNLYESDEIYRAMLSFRRFPEEIFTGPEEWREMLRAAIY
jgi:spermidine synthase